MSPLSGIKVVELARILAGPWAGQTLADLGAEVIKVEAPEGDDTRRWGPPFIERFCDCLGIIQFLVMFAQEIVWIWAVVFNI